MMGSEKEEAARREKQTGFWWHWQNLKREERSPRKLLWGRAWLHKRPKGEVSLEWAVPSDFHLSLVVGGNDQLSLALCLGLFALYLSFDEWAMLHRWKATRAPFGKKTTLSFYDLAFHWCLWTKEDEWDSKTPAWRDGFFDIRDFFFGKAAYTKVNETPIPVVIPMPEGAYRATWTRYHQTWKRPRWPRTRRQTGSDIDILEGIPIPGKGENSWDCEDAVMLSISIPVATVEEAIQRVIENVLNTRLRYGGKDWRPSA